jgi:hypothetical protein
MDAMAEGEMAVVGAPDVKSVRLRELARVPVGCVDHQEQALSPSDHPIGDGNIFARDAHHRRRGAVVPQELLHGRRREPGVFAPRSGLGRVPDERERAVADEVRGGFVAGEQEQHAAGDELVLLQPVGPVLDGQERRHEVIGRGRPAARHEALEIAVQLDHAVGRPLVLVARRPRAPDEGRQLVRPRLELLGIFGRNTQKVADHGHRQGVREIVDEVHLTGRGHLRQQTVDDRSDARAPELDHARAENPAEGAPEPGVNRRIGEHDPEPDLMEKRLDRVARGRALARQEGCDSIRGQSGVREGHPDVGVTRQDPTAEDLAPVDGILLAETAQRRVRVGHHLRPPRVVRGHCRTRSPRGSQSGSAATRPSTHSPKNSIATDVPGLASSAGRYA